MKNKITMKSISTISMIFMIVSVAVGQQMEFSSTGYMIGNNYFEVKTTILINYNDSTIYFNEADIKKEIYIFYGTAPAPKSETFFVGQKGVDKIAVAVKDYMIIILYDNGDMKMYKNTRATKVIDENGNVTTH